jgi:Membrane protein involved in the export of O-antigen and teichoic acid
MFKKLKGINILIISGLIAKILAAIYRFPYQNIVGDRGFYAYQQVYPFYAIITTLSLTALPNFFSTLFDSEDKDYQDEGQFFQVILTLSILSFVFLLAFSSQITRFIGNDSLSLSFIWAISPLILVPFLSILRGYSQSRLDMTTTAVSQVLEQTIRVLMILAAALSFHHFTNSIYTVSMLSMLGSFLASLVALIYLYKHDPLNFLSLFKNFWDIREKIKILHKFGFSSLIFIFFMIYMLIMQMIDVFIVKDSLVEAGIANIEAESLKGIYDRGQPFLQLGLVFITSIFTSSLPKLTKNFSQDKLINLFDIAVYLSVTITVGLLLILPQMNQVLFKDNLESQALAIFSSQIALVGIIQFYHHKFFLENKNMTSFIILLMGLLVKLLLTHRMTLLYGLVGASSSSFISLSFVLVLYILTSRVFPRQLFNIRYLLSLSLMSVSLLISINMFHVEHRFSKLLVIIFAVSISSLVFLYSAKKLKAFSNDLWQEFRG